MSDPPFTRDGPSSGDAFDPLDATIERNAGVVRRGKRGHAFLKSLGLSLPVTVDDVKQAYYVRARETHPDHAGGSATDFREVQEAFDEAMEFAKRNGKRLPWLGAQLPKYVAQRNVLELVDRLGGEVVVQRLDWLADTVGADFAQLAERLTMIDLSGRSVTDDHLMELTEEEEGLEYLEAFSLADTAITNASAKRLSRPVNLKWLDLRGTKVSYGQRKRLARLPGMERVEGASWWGEWFRR